MDEKREPRVSAPIDITTVSEVVSITGASVLVNSSPEKATLTNYFPTKTELAPVIEGLTNKKLDIDMQNADIENIPEGEHTSDTPILIVEDGTIKQATITAGTTDTDDQNSNEVLRSEIATPLLAPKSVEKGLRDIEVKNTAQDTEITNIKTSLGIVEGKIQFLENNQTLILNTLLLQSTINQNLQSQITDLYTKHDEQSSEIASKRPLATTEVQSMSDTEYFEISTSEGARKILKSNIGGTGGSNDFMAKDGSNATAIPSLPVNENTQIVIQNGLETDPKALGRTSKGNLLAGYIKKNNPENDSHTITLDDKVYLGFTQTSNPPATTETRDVPIGEMVDFFQAQIPQKVNSDVLFESNPKLQDALRLVNGNEDGSPIKDPNGEIEDKLVNIQTLFDTFYRPPSPSGKATLPTEIGMVIATWSDLPPDYGFLLNGGIILKSDFPDMEQWIAENEAGDSFAVGSFDKEVSTYKQFWNEDVFEERFREIPIDGELVKVEDGKAFIFEEIDGKIELLEECEIDGETVFLEDSILKIKERFFAGTKTVFEESSIFEDGRALTPDEIKVPDVRSYFARAKSGTRKLASFEIEDSGRHTHPAKTQQKGITTGTTQIEIIRNNNNTGAEANLVIKNPTASQELRPKNFAVQYFMIGKKPAGGSSGTFTLTEEASKVLSTSLTSNTYANLLTILDSTTLFAQKNGQPTTLGQMIKLDTLDANAHIKVPKGQGLLNIAFKCVRTGTGNNTLTFLVQRKSSGASETNFVAFREISVASSSKPVDIRISLNITSGGGIELAGGVQIYIKSTSADSFTDAFLSVESSSTYLGNPAF